MGPPIHIGGCPVQSPKAFPIWQTQSGFRFAARKIVCQRGKRAAIADRVRAVAKIPGDLHQPLLFRRAAQGAARGAAQKPLARERLLGGAPRRALRSAAEQQGLMQIARDFCDRSNAVCDGCPFPALANDFAGCESKS